MKNDFFSPIAADYARFRPLYPSGLFAYLDSLAPGQALAWDCATGSGQAAQGLVDHFDRVIATDHSTELLAQAVPQERITFRPADALASGIPDGTVDLVTVANAMHWFHGEAFEREVRRVLRPRGIIAAWCVGRFLITPEVDALTRHAHDVIVDPFWIEPNRIVERGYADLHFGFEELTPPAFTMTSSGDLGAVEGYMRTWSASVKYVKHHGTDPIALVHDRLLAAWGDPAQKRPVRWQLDLRVGRVQESGSCSDS